MKLLIIKATTNDQTSRTNKLLEAFLKSYKQTNPNDEVEILDLYKTDIDFLREKELNDGMPNAQKYLDTFIKSDKVLFVYPYWNWKMPAIVYAYIDYIMVNGRTFRYNEKGEMVQLAPGKKYGYLVSRGGDYSQSEMYKFDVSYLKAIMGALGEELVGQVEFDGTDVYTGEEFEKHLTAKVEEATTLGSKL